MQTAAATTNAFASLDQGKRRYRPKRARGPKGRQATRPLRERVGQTQGPNAKAVYWVLKTSFPNDIVPSEERIWEILTSQDGEGMGNEKSIVDAACYLIERRRDAFLVYPTGEVEEPVLNEQTWGDVEMVFLAALRLVEGMAAARQVPTQGGARAVVAFTAPFGFSLGSPGKMRRVNAVAKVMQRRFGGETVRIVEKPSKGRVEEERLPLEGEGWVADDLVY